jgi:hypothetical protein
MKTNTLALGLGVLTLALAWRWNRRADARWSAVLAGQAQLPVLPSTPIGTGYLGPITGTTPSYPPMAFDVVGDVTAPLGTDQLLPGIDPVDPTIARYVEPGFIASAPSSTPSIDVRAIVDETAGGPPPPYVDFFV